jgi:muramoyltetrapeptide carboxypeptidase LdcA involved in peptidoglycan recycling
MPVISGFPHGHRLPNLTVPCGMITELDTKGPTLAVNAHL